MSVVTSGTDVYFAGYEGPNAKLWRNGKGITVAVGVAFSVFVVPH
jgi:hypothetical protein